MDIYERIREDHRIQRELAARIVKTEGDSPERRELWKRFRAEAVAHANAEEQSFYSRLMHEASIQEQTRHSVSEHKEADDLIEKLDDMDMSSGQWIRSFEKLRDELEHHMREEEKDVFAKARKVLGDETEDAMQAEFDRRKNAELTHEA